MAYRKVLLKPIYLMLLTGVFTFRLSMAIACKPVYRSIYDWCIHKNKLSGTTRNLIETLLLKAETTDCTLAQQRLSQMTYLNLDATPLSDPNQVTAGPISDLRPLSTLTQLKGLNLYHQQLTDLRPLASLVNLGYINLQGTGITKIELLSALKNLKSLDLRDNPITDFRPLGDLPKLKQLYLGDL
ncbi:leucine-rich repeat domain-containing protein [Acaryochloris marina]|uniref:leucine-rich repeat domain-containing protein n=1 Tax=Acaryochloris marina TaxID=155978 RepID=UPI001BB06C54|nr:leucine-rich repeat domain-containing protein [Acaryochloris marina]QUY43352.1 leucine-rich repeat domain-containing protein [Acaryochloris marina S15]